MGARVIAYRKLGDEEGASGLGNGDVEVLGTAFAQIKPLGDKDRPEVLVSERLQPFGDEGATSKSGTPSSKSTIGLPARPGTAVLPT